mmetsp:Transcript_77607/g.95101  ORF Transcript_77607/g.95101 Transcript_77607/m.95101 type:complete len:407 (+) Transcript_77607:30-1250(+)
MSKRGIYTKEVDLCELKAQIEAHESSAWCLAWLPTKKDNNNILFSGSSNGDINMWNITINNENKYNIIKLKTINDTISSIIDMKIITVPNNALVTLKCPWIMTVTSLDGVIRLYKLLTDDIVLFDKIDMNYPLNKYYKLMQINNNDNNKSKEYKKTLMNKEQNYFGGCWSSDINYNANIIATGDQFGQIYLYPIKSDKFDIPTIMDAQVPYIKYIQKNKKDKDNNNISKQYRSSNSIVTTVSFNHGLHNKDWLCISCQSSKRLEIFDVNKCKSLYTMKGIYKIIRDTSWFHGKDPYILCCSDDKYIYIFDIRQSNKKNMMLTSLSGHKSSVTSIDFGPSQPTQIIASVSTDNTLRIWDLNKDTNKNIAIYNNHSDSIWKVRFNKNKNKLATIGDDGLLNIYSINPK